MFDLDPKFMPELEEGAEVRAARWDRYGRIGLYVYMAVCLVLGFGTGWAWASGWGGALSVALATMIGCGLGGIGLLGLKLLALVRSNAATLERIRQRVDELELSIEMEGAGFESLPRADEREQEVGGGLPSVEERAERRVRELRRDAAAVTERSEVGADDVGEVSWPEDDLPSPALIPYRLVDRVEDRGEAGDGAGRVELEEPSGGEWERKFRASLRANDLRVARDLWVEAGRAVSVARRRELEEQMGAMAERVGQTLREAFVASFEVGDYAGALQWGEEIADLFPDSRMAEEFLTRRGSLERLAGEGRVAGSGGQASGEGGGSEGRRIQGRGV